MRIEKRAPVFLYKTFELKCNFGLIEQQELAYIADT